MRDERLSLFRGLLSWKEELRVGGVARARGCKEGLATIAAVCLFRSSRLWLLCVGNRHTTPLELGNNPVVLRNNTPYTVGPYDSHCGLQYAHILVLMDNWLSTTLHFVLIS